MPQLNILLSSAGRRPYLVEWFREALTLNELSGRVILADSDAFAPASGFADAHISAVPVQEAGYEAWLRSTLEEHRIGLAVSVNDFELSRWSRLPEDFGALVRLSAHTQSFVEDKLETASVLGEAGLNVPPTWTGRDLGEVGNGPVIIKSRFGSGSRGLRVSQGAGVDDVVRKVASEMYDRMGQRIEDSAMALENVIVQPQLTGQEFGLDIVNDLSGRFVSVLARRKVAMRAGETDKAVTVDAAPFINVGRQISEVLGHRGLIDVDVFQDDAGVISVIDVNPRFGGGYPFSHVAGARVPAAYAAWSVGRMAPKQWTLSTVGVMSAKYVGIAEVTS
ncbi:MAG: ATP-grasp domain-containing protein [Microbacteriaceae bacterium]|uniref:ATP-grasp domain-containing protein n=1 Tax=Microbacterium gubbeenense TaxID=159896 RepID=UPI003F99FD69